MAVIVNEISIRNKAGEALKAKKFQNIAYLAARTRFVFAKQGLLEDFNESEITKELDGGNVEISSVLPYGNLYSFLGFNIGDRPTDDIRRLLQDDNDIKLINEPKFSNSAANRRVYYEFPVQYPSLQDIYDATPTPGNWSNKPSFVQIIEEGVGTFASYIYHEFFGDYSRSRTGLQRKNPRPGVRDQVLGIKWISKILDDFKSKFK